MGPITGFKETKILIAAIKDRPALYNPKNPQYADKEFKIQIWQEVFEILTPNWNEMSKHAREKRGMEIKGKWHTCRSSYIRYLRHLRTLPSGAAAKRKWHLFESMDFLAPFVRHHNNAGGSKPKRAPQTKPVPKPADDDVCESIEEGKDIQRRWKSIRDAYVKELRMLKEQGETCYKTPGSKRKPYIYFDNLSFLRPLIDQRLYHKQLAAEMEEHNDAAYPFVMMTDDDSVDCIDHHLSIKDESNEITTFPEIVTTSVDEPDMDPDRLFLLSLVPSMKQLGDQDKSSVKIQMMQLLHQFLFKDEESESA